MYPESLSLVVWNNLGRTTSLNVIGFWPLGNKRLTGISSNRWTCLFILISSGNLPPVLNDTVVGACIDPNIFSEVNCEYDLESSRVCESAICQRVSGVKLEISQV